MSTNSNTGDLGQGDLITSEPEENLAATAYDRTVSSFDFDRDHGSEVEAAIRGLMAAQADGIRHAA